MSQGVFGAITCTVCGGKIGSEAYRSQKRRGDTPTCSNACRRELRKQNPPKCKSCGQEIPLESYFVTKCDECRKNAGRGVHLPKITVSEETIETLHWYYTTEDYRDFVKACREGLAA